MIGTYVFRENGRVIQTSRNLITASGRREIMRFMSGQSGTLGRSIGIGAGDLEPLLTDSRLVLEYERILVEVTSPDYSRGLVVFKGILPQQLECNIYEIGLWSGAATLEPFANILTFAEGAEPWNDPTWNYDFTRMGGSGLRLSASTGATTQRSLNTFNADLESVGFNDTFSFAFYVNDPNAASVRLRFLVADSTRYFQYTATTLNQGYNVVNFTKADFLKVGILDASEVVRVNLAITAKATDAPVDPELGPLRDYTGTRVDFDRLIVRPVGTNVDNTLISRSTLAAPVRKTPVSSMEIEYYLELLP